MIILTAPLQIWSNTEGRVHFMTLPEDQSDEVKAQALMERRGFGSVRVEVTIDDVTWRTSVFPIKRGGYFLPVKAAVCRSLALSRATRSPPRWNCCSGTFSRASRFTLP